MISVSAVWKGKFFPAEPSFGRVHSVFDHAVNLEFPSGLAALLPEDSPRISWGAGLRCPYSFKKIFREGSPVRIVRNRVHAEGMEIELGEAMEWRSPNCNGTSPLLGTPEKMVSIMAKYGFPGFCAMFDPKSDFAESPVGRHAALNAAMLAHAVSDGSMSGAASAVSALSGLGFGLTPSGDDFLAGFIAGLGTHLENRRFLKIHEHIRDMMSSIVSHSTTRIAAEYVRYACQGSFAGDVSNVLLGLLGNAPLEMLDASVRTLLNFGSTSGGDTLAGIHAGAWLASPCCGGLS